MATAVKNVSIQGMFVVCFPLFLCISLQTIAQSMGSIEYFLLTSNIPLKYSYSLCLIDYKSGRLKFHGDLVYCFSILYTKNGSLDHTNVCFNHVWSVNEVFHKIINFDNKILKYILFVLILLRSLTK